MRPLIAFLLTFFPLLSIGENKSSILRHMEIRNKDIVSIEEIFEKTRESFNDNGGMFQILIPKESFVFKAPNCKKNIILRMDPTYLKKIDQEEALEQHWLLLGKFKSIKEGKIKSVNVPINPRPYMKIGKNGEPILEYCNAFIPADFWKYSPDNIESNTLGKPVEQQKALLHKSVSR